MYSEYFGPVHALPGLQVKFAGIEVQSFSNGAHYSECTLDIGLNIRSSTNKSFNAYVIYTVDKWTTIKKSNIYIFDLECEEDSTASIQCNLQLEPNTTTPFYFAACVYDSNSTYWDNNNGWNYGYEIKNISNESGSSIDLKPLGNYSAK